MDKITEQSASKMYIQDMVSYSIITIRRRAFSDVRDGLKPVQRRTIYDMLTLNAIGHTIKSAKITGDTMGQYHPHGDSSIYSCMAVLANWYSCKVPLIKGQGNWGSVMGDGQAAPRYTEAALSDFCYDCIIGELKGNKFIVDWKNNFDNTTQEPEFLPVKVPLLLINGSFGIAVGIAAKIPPHNLVEVIEATRTLMKNPKANIVLIPDHCQPLKLIGGDWKTISETGMGSYKVRGIIEIKDENGYPTLHVRSLPDGKTVDGVKAKVCEMAKTQLPMVKDVYDQSDKDNAVDLVIELKKGSDPQYVKEMLYAKAGVQDTVSVNFEAIDDINPYRYSYKNYLLRFIEQRKMVKFRLYANKLSDASTRYHKLDTFIKAIESGEIDKIVDMVKKQDIIDNSELTEYLIKKLHITDIQAGYILSSTIQQLSKGHLKLYKKEFAELSKAIPIYRKAVTDNGEMIYNEIDQELLDIEKKYGSPRICKVSTMAEDNNIPSGTFKIVITSKNLIRKIPDSDKVGIIRGDNPKFVLRVDNAENLLIFDNKGKVFKMPIYKIPITDRQNAGTDIRILSKNLTADIIAVYYEPMLKKVIEGGRKHHLVIVTKNNIIKKLDIEDFLNVNISGLMYSKIKEDDEVVGLAIAPTDLDVLLYSDQKVLRTSLKDIPLLKRNAAGSKAMNTTEPIEGLSIIYPDAQYILVISNNGKFNKFPISGLLPHPRARAGINVIKLSSNDRIHSIFGVNDSDTIRIVTSEGIVDIPTATIASKSSIAAGQKVADIKGLIIRCDIVR